MIALLHKGRPVMGIIDQPIQKERWFGVDGERATFNGQPAATRACTQLANAYMYSTAPEMFKTPGVTARHEAERLSRPDPLRAWREREDPEPLQ